eukprot:6805496-Pyramimonas_sp.AAC.1
MSTESPEDARALGQPRLSSNPMPLIIAPTGMIIFRGSEGSRCSSNKKGSSSSPSRSRSRSRSHK